MKKLFLTFAFAVAAVAASAQVYVGGEVSFNRDYKNNSTDFTIAPEVGYVLNEDWAIGTSIEYDHLYRAGGKINAVGVAPYARYTFAKFGNVNLFVDGGFTFLTAKPKGSDSLNAWEVGLKPGVAVNLTDKLSFVAHAGFFGWGDNEIQDTKYIGAKLDGNDLSFGLYYNF